MQKKRVWKVFGIFTVLFTVVLVTLVFGYFSALVKLLQYMQLERAPQLTLEVKQAFESLLEENQKSVEEVITDFNKTYYMGRDIEVVLLVTEETSSSPVIYSARKTDLDIIDVFTNFAEQFLLEGGEEKHITMQGEPNILFFLGARKVQIDNQDGVLGVIWGTSDSLNGWISKSQMTELVWYVFLISVLIAMFLSVIVALVVSRPMAREMRREVELNTMRKDFIANASHEMKTPISIISGYSESLLDGILSKEEQEEYIQGIYDEAQRMKELIHHMLEASRIQSSVGSMEQTSIQLKQTVETIIHRFEKQIADKKIYVALEAEENVLITADENRIEQAIINLLTNAIFHTPEKGTIVISVKRKGSMISFQIENEGECIPEETMAHVWESFYRADKSHNREEGRFGLGLSIVKEAVEQSGGKVGVKNTEMGIQFYFELPMKSDSSKRKTCSE